MKFSFETRSNLSPEKIWPFYEDINKWFLWENDLESISLEKGFVVGSNGKMKLENMPEMTFTLISVTPNQEFSDETKIPNLGTIVFNHVLKMKDKLTIVQHSVEFIPENRSATSSDLSFVNQIFADVPASVFALLEAAK